MKKKVIKAAIMLIGLWAISPQSSKAQQSIQFTQYIFNSLSVNPAYAGYKEEWFAQLALRSQWVGIEGAPKTGQLSIDGVTNEDTRRVGLGLQITGDKLGPQSASSAYFNYAYRLKLNDDDTQRLSFGLAVGVTQYSLDGSMLDPITANDPSLTMGTMRSTIPDFRFGVYYYNPKWYLGASLMDLVSGESSNSIFDWGNGNMLNIKRKRSLYVMAGSVFGAEDGFKIKPSILWKEDFKGPSSLDLNAMLIFENKFWIGGSYRTGINLWDKEYRKDQSLNNTNSVSAIAQFYVTEKLRIGYSYDYILSDLSTVQNGSHEITLGMTFGKKRLVSPRFF